MPSNQPTVLQVTWDWRRKGADRSGDSKSDHASLRRAALIQALITGAIAAFLLFGIGHQLFGRIVAGIAVVVLFLGISLPNVYRHVHRFGQTLGRWVGTGLTYILLVPFFFLFFVPVALWLRLRGRDPLHRTWRDSRWTYWVSSTRQARSQNIEKLFLRENRAARSELRTVGSLPVRDEDSQSRGATS